MFILKFASSLGTFEERLNVFLDKKKPHKSVLRFFLKAWAKKKICELVSFEIVHRS